MGQRQAIECKSTISCSVRWQKTNFFRDKRNALFTLTRFHFVNRVQGNNLAGSDLSKKNCSVNLRNVCLKRSDWLLKYFQPIRMLKTVVTQIQAGHFNYSIGLQLLRSDFEPGYRDCVTRLGVISNLLKIKNLTKVAKIFGDYLGNFEKH